jgi:hypothetical protein
MRSWRRQNNPGLQALVVCRAPGISGFRKNQPGSRKLPQASSHKPLPVFTIGTHGPMVCAHGQGRS